MASMKQPAMFALRKVGQAERPPIEEAMLAHGLPIPEQEYRFAQSIGRNWRLDYAFVQFHVGVEIDGGNFGRYIVIERGHERRRGQSIPIKPGTALRVGGRHATGQGMAGDAEKLNEAQIFGWIVIRVSTTDIRDGRAIDPIKRALVARGWRAK
jgi:very-short-patch-repair endonuclease